MTAILAASMIAGGIVLVDPPMARAELGALFATQPGRPTVSVGAALFPETIPGFDEELGLTLPPAVLAGPAALGVGVRAGPGLVLPTLGFNTSYDSNVLGVRRGPGSVILETTPAVSFDRQWSRGRFGALLGVDRRDYVATPSQSRTDVTFGAGGSVAVGRGEATLAYSHLALHDDPTAIGAIPSSTPTPFNVDDLRASYDVAFGRVALRPFADLSHWSYGQSNIGGVAFDQSNRDRDILQAGLAGRFTLGERRDVLTTISLVRNDYLHAVPGRPTPSSTDLLALGGLDYERDGAVRFRILAGLQARRFDDASLQDRVAPVGQATVTWTPQRQTTVALTLARSLEDLAQEDTGGTIYSRAEVEATQELRRDLVTRVRLGVQTAQFLQLGGVEAAVYGRTALEWSINRFTKVVGDVEARRNSAPVANVAAATGPYTRVIAHVGVAIAI